MKSQSRRILLAVVVGAVALLPTGLQAQPTAGQEEPPAPGSPPVLVENQSAREVRGELDRILNQQPSTVRQVLRVDPGLMINDEYLAPYPALAAFLAEHPEIPRNPVYFVGTPNTQTGNIMEALFAMTAGLAFFGGLIWLVRTLIDYRRWSRLSRIQTEVHTKLLDRFTTSEDLQAYFASAAGRRFLESAPIEVHSSAASAPASRIMWSLQVGVVLALGGAGLHLAIPNLTDDAASDPLSVIGTIAIALGIGFIVSAGASFILSQRLGLLPPSGASPGSQA
jgi:hypothetical protein